MSLAHAAPLPEPLADAPAALPPACAADASCEAQAALERSRQALVRAEALARDLRAVADDIQGAPLACWHPNILWEVLVVATVGDDAVIEAAHARVHAPPPPLPLRDCGGCCRRWWCDQYARVELRDT